MNLNLPAHAKINLGLHVLGKRLDGYHDIETVFLRIPWSDQIYLRSGSGLSMTCSDPTLPVDERNLCMAAALRLKEAGRVTTGVSIHLDKNVPYGAGLGSGSSDAATTLRGLKDLWELVLPDGTLHTLALGLGSDVPFFLGPPAALGTGRGEQLTPLVDRETGEPFVLPFPLVVVVPPVHVSTAMAYGLVTPMRSERPDLSACVLSGDPERWRRELCNDFEAPVCARFPEIALTRQMLIDAGADYVSLSGSGSAVFGVFTSDGEAQAAAEVARGQGLQVWYGKV